MPRIHRHGARVPMSSGVSFIQASVVLGYVVSAVLYFVAWLSPAFGSSPGLLKWVAFDKLGLAEFLSIHAATFLAAVTMARASGEEGTRFPMIFWMLLLFYGALAGGGYLFHRSGQV